jgi:hypothetical protein
MREKSRITIYSFVALVLLICVSSSSSKLISSDIDKIAYVSFNRTGVSPSPPQKLQKVLSIVRADDSPFSLIKLPWAFNFFGNKINNLFVDPNGAVRQDYNLTNGRMGEFPVTNVSNFGIIAGYLTDLYPANASKTANITSYIFQDVVTITFSKIPIFRFPSNLISFRISIYNDSRVVIDYDQVDTFYPKYVSGLRAPISSNKTHITKSQVSRGRREWFTTTKGIYPRKASVKSGSQFVACPISRAWGAFPKTVNIASNSKTITLYPLFYSCHKDLDIAINFDANSNPSSLSPSPAKCVYQFALTSPTLVCDISTLSFTGSLYGQIVWRVTGSTALYARMPVNSILFEVVNVAPGTLDYSMNVDVPLGCSAKSLSTSNYSCLGLPCTRTVPVLYQNPICGIFNTTKIKQDNCSVNLAYDTRKDCCPVEQLDCAGICNGKSKVALDRRYNNTQVCCLSPLVIDCRGVCDGPTIIDACAVCGGRNMKGIGCKTGVLLTAPGKNNTLYPKFDYSQTKVLYSIMPVTMSNDNNVSVTVTVNSSIHNDGVGPELSFSSNNFTLLPKATKEVKVNVSVARLYFGADYTWEVKTITFSYSKGTSEKKYRYLVEVYPAASNCSSVKDVDSCMRLPACIMCATHSSLRVLRAIEEENERELEESIRSGNQTLIEFEEFIGEGGAEESRYYRHRELFTGLVPLALGIFADPGLTGECRNGFYTSSCANAKYSSAAPPANSFSYLPFAITGLLLCSLSIW